MNWTRNLCCCIVMTGGLSILLTGCTPYKETKKDLVAAKKHPDKGPRGGSLAEWGADDFHVEYTVDNASKTAVLYILSGEIQDGLKVDASKVTDVKMTVVDPKLEMDMKYDPKRSEGKKVVFIGTNDAFGDAKAASFKGTISGKVDGTPFLGDFPLKPGQ